MVREVIFKDWCTPHLRESEDQERVEAVWTGTISINGEPPRQLDLCDNHYAQIIGVLPKALELYGDKPGGQAASPAGNGTRNDSSREVCPVAGCGKTYEYHASLTSHIRKHHHTTLDALRGRPTEKFPCDVPGCGFIAGSGGGLGSHQQAKHGITGTSYTAVLKRQQATG